MKFNKVELEIVKLGNDIVTDSVDIASCLVVGQLVEACDFE